jgi:hypothetical protein
MGDSSDVIKMGVMIGALTLQTGGLATQPIGFSTDEFGQFNIVYAPKGYDGDMTLAAVKNKLGGDDFTPTP